MLLLLFLGGSWRFLGSGVKKRMEFFRNFKRFGNEWVLVFYYVKFLKVFFSIIYLLVNMFSFWFINS